MSTIAAISTARGAGAIGIVRISGDAAGTLLQKIFTPYSGNFSTFLPWVLHRGYVRDGSGVLLDEVLAVHMPAPKTYTGEEMAEIQCHGNPVILNAVLRRLFQLGAEPAEPGEFTKRAFLAGRMDLTQAEAVAELVSCVSRKGLATTVERLSGTVRDRISQIRARTDAVRAQLACACDFPDDEIGNISSEEVLHGIREVEADIRRLLADQNRSRLLQEGARVVLAGRVNSGKSSLMNAILGRERALVTDIPGTTRDFLEEYCDLDGLAVRLIDTAGLRQEQETDLDPVEALGIDRSRDCIRDADAVLVVLDGTQWDRQMLTEASCPDACYASLLEEADRDVRPVLLVWNKNDVAEPSCLPPVWGKGYPCVSVSARTGDGFPELFRVLRSELFSGMDGSEHVACNVRQSRALERSLEDLSAIRQALERHETYDCLASLLDSFAYTIGEVTGSSTPQDVLNDIFGRFCIGK